MPLKQDEEESEKDCVMNLMCRPSLFAHVAVVRKFVANWNGGCW